MIKNQTNIRVRYGETDQMGYVYYGNYAQFFEVGRVEWLRSLGVSYKSLEDSGIMLPVIQLNINLSNRPLVKIEFDFEIFNEKKELLTTGFTRLVFMDMKKNKPVKAPEYLLDQIYAEFT